MFSCPEPPTHLCQSNFVVLFSNSLCQGICKMWLLNNLHVSVKHSCSFDGKQFAGLSDLFCNLDFSSRYKPNICLAFQYWNKKIAWSHGLGVLSEITKLRFMPVINLILWRCGWSAWSDTRRSSRATVCLRRQRKVQRMGTRRERSQVVPSNSHHSSMYTPLSCCLWIKRKGWCLT